MRKIKAITALFATASIYMVVASGSVQAEEWQFEATPYVWAAANEGSSGVYGLGPNGDINPEPSNIDISFDELVDATEIGMMFNFAAKKGDWLLFSELTYLEVSDSQSVETSANTNLGVNVDIDGAVVDLAGGYKLVENEKFQLYGYAGMRYMDLDASIGVENAETTIGELNMGDSWIDGFVGIHTRYKINDTFSFNTRLEVGGLGETDEAYMAHIAINHQIAKNWELKYFYRYQKIDYRGDGFIYDMEITGPGIGVTYTF